MDTISTPRLYLRELTLNDKTDLARILSDDESMKHYPRTYSAGEVEQWILENIGRYQRDGFGLWAVIRKTDDAFLGDCGITLQDIDGDLLPEIGFHIIREYWGQGFAPEAAQACLAYAAGTLRMKHIYSYTRIENAQSQRVMEKIGMTKKKTYTKNGIQYIVYEYAVKD